MTLLMLQLILNVTGGISLQSDEGIVHRERVSASHLACGFFSCFIFFYGETCHPEISLKR